MSGLRIGPLLLLCALLPFVRVARACPLCSSGSDDGEGGDPFGLSQPGRAAAIAPWALGSAVAGGGYLALRARNGRRGRHGRM